MRVFTVYILARSQVVQQFSAVFCSSRKLHGLPYLFLINKEKVTFQVNWWIILLWSEIKSQERAGLGTGERDWLDELYHMDNSCNREVNFCCRLINLLRSRQTEPAWLMQSALKKLGIKTSKELIVGIFNMFLFICNIFVFLVPFSTVSFRFWLPAHYIFLHFLFETYALTVPLEKINSFHVLMHLCKKYNGKCSAWPV